MLTALLIGLLFALSFAYAVRAGPSGMRVLLIAVIAIAPLRGALLALADSIDLPNALLTFNAIQPTLIAACALAAAIADRDIFQHEPPLLVAAWIVIAVVALADLATQTVGIKLYAIGLAQYTVYPTFALLAWALTGPRDVAPLIRLLVALGTVVAVSIFLEAAGVHFVQASHGVVAGGAVRYGGATGSFLHSAIFLGTTIVLALGGMVATWSRRTALLIVAVIGIMLAGLALTYSRGGLAIAGIGAAVLLAVLGRRDRLRIVAVVVTAAAVGLAVAALIGPSPAQVWSRSSSGASVNGDRGNKLRLDRMRDALDAYGDLPPDQKGLGDGLASTGNARKLTAQRPNPVESYPLKLLLETGALGVLAIGAILVWALLRFAFASWAAADPLLKAAGAAGVALTAESLVYPTLEVQLLSLTWWLLVVLCLRVPRRPAREVPEAARSG